VLQNEGWGETGEWRECLMWGVMMCTESDTRVIGVLA